MMARCSGSWSISGLCRYTTFRATNFLGMVLCFAKTTCTPSSASASAYAVWRVSRVWGTAYQGEGSLAQVHDHLIELPDGVGVPHHPILHGHR